MLNKNKKYYIYIIYCNNNSYYTGITTDYKRRFDEHLNSKKGAKYTRNFKPEYFSALWETENRSIATKIEIAIKKLSKNDKELLISNNRYLKKYFSNVIDVSKIKKIRIRHNFFSN